MTRPSRREIEREFDDLRARLEAAEQRAELVNEDTHVGPYGLFLFNSDGEILAIADGGGGWDYSVSDEDFERDESGHPIVADFTGGADDLSPTSTTSATAWKTLEPHSMPPLVRSWWSARPAATRRLPSSSASTATHRVSPARW